MEINKGTTTKGPTNQGGKELRELPDYSNSATKETEKKLG